MGSDDDDDDDDEGVIRKMETMWYKMRWRNVKDRT
jgi:hypothetical protein